MSVVPPAPGSAPPPITGPSSLRTPLGAGLPEHLPEMLLLSPVTLTTGIFGLWFFLC